MTPEKLARKFHEAYERLAPKYGYETKKETRKFVPESKNGRLMIAVADEILTFLFSRYHAPIAQQAIAGAGEAGPQIVRTDCIEFAKWWYGPGADGCFPNQSNVTVEQGYDYWIKNVRTTSAIAGR